MTTWAVPSGRSLVRRPATDGAARRRARRPLAITVPSGPTTSTASSARSRPRRRDPGRQQRPAPLEQGAAGAGVDDDPTRRADGERDPQLAGGEALGPGRTTVPTPGTSVAASTSTPVAVRRRR